ncbi:MAG: photosynthetic reaction center subunit H [Pseudomonadota bacterium]
MDELGALGSYLDVAQVTLYVFWVFFFGLLFYLQRETRREGYPLESDASGAVTDHGVIFMPEQKVFKLRHGHGEYKAPDYKRETRELKLKPLDVWSGAPKEPTGNPMKDGVGPASYAERADSPDLTHDGRVKIKPMRALEGYTVASRDPQPIGCPVVGCDKKVGAHVTDIWIDQSENVVRYYEVSIAGQKDAKTVLLPANFVKFGERPTHLYVHAITSRQFVDVPHTKKPEEITFLEEDIICGYYGGGQLYATPDRVEPLL